MSVQEDVLHRQKVPAQKTPDSPMLSEQERTRIVHEWNDTAKQYPDCCAHALFEEVAARVPDATALVCGRLHLTYRELNERANQLARHLQKRGIGPEALAGVCFERSPEIVIAPLAIWKAGGAYVPLDPGYPARRLSFMLQDSSAKILLTNTKHRKLSGFDNEKTLFLDAAWTEIARENRANVLSGAAPSNLAYVIYTSGSTGEPKGVMIPHRGLVNYLCWSRET